MKPLILSLALALLVAAPAELRAEVPAGTDVSTLNAAGNREKQYRHRVMRAYRPLTYINKRLKVGNYSRYENPTGIWFTAGETARIKLAAAAPVEAYLKSFAKDGKETTFVLQPGDNSLRMEHDGLLYINYRADDPAAAPPIELDIAGGKVNGVFTRHDDNNTWKALVAKAVAPNLDCVGERCQLLLDMDNVREFVPEDGVSMLRNYDRIIEIQQKDILGWDQYKLHPGNHIMGRVMYDRFMHADGLGAAFVNKHMGPIIKPETMLRQSWPIAHEFGHVNQTRPVMMWTGMTEVTNNIFSALAQFKLSPSFLRLEHEKGRTPDGYTLRGSRYDSYVNSAIVRKQMWQFQAGPDDGNRPVDGSKPGDPFVICIPYWQLYLYLTAARGNDMFYPDLFEMARNTDATNMTMGELRTLFYVNACKAAKLDLTDFFVATKMLTPMNRMVGDYSSTYVTVTPQMIQEAMSQVKAAHFPKPDSKVIYYINGNNYNIYRSKAKLVPSPEFKPEVRDRRFVVPAGTWKNAVAFEAYAGKQLLRISLLGLDHEDNVSTTVIVPEEADSVKAVQWDGKRETIWKK